MNQLLAELRRRNVFRVAAAYLVGGWLVLQVTSLIADAAAMPDWADSLVLILLLAGLPVAIIVAWAFELTPEGMKKTDAADGAVDIKPIGPTDYVLIGLMVVVLTMTGLQLVGGGGTGPDANLQSAETATADGVAGAVPVEISSSTIAVLAFEDLSPGGDQGYFSDGISEEILNVLVRVEALDVTSRTSAFLYKGSGLRIPEIAAELGVRHVLEGSVRRAGNNIRITAQLIDAVDDTHLWSQTYDRPLTVENVFEVQDDIARAIVDALGEVMGLTSSLTTTLAETHAAPTSDVEAWDLYLQARRLYRGRGEFAAAEALLVEAVRRDPEFADGWAQLAAVIEVGYAYEGEMLFRPQLVQEYTDRALVLNPESALAHAVQGLAVMDTQLDGDHFASIDWALALSRLARALELDPDNTEALNWIGYAYSAVGEFEQAQVGYRRCSRVDPIHAACFANTVGGALNTGDLEEARQLVRHGLERGITGRDVNWLFVLAQLADRDVFLTYTSRMDILRDFRDHAALYDALTSPGVDYPNLREKLNVAWRGSPPSVYSQGILMAALGDYSQGADPVTAWFPAMRHFRMSEMFKRQMRANGILDYWQEHGFPSQCRAVPAQDGGEDDFECD